MRFLYATKIKVSKTLGFYIFRIVHWFQIKKKIDFPLHLRECVQVTYEYSFRPVGQKEAPKFLAGAEAESRSSEIVKKARLSASR